MADESTPLMPMCKFTIRPWSELPPASRTLSEDGKSAIIIPFAKEGGTFTARSLDFMSRLATFSGPGVMIAVGSMDPGERNAPLSVAQRFVRRG